MRVQIGAAHTLDAICISSALKSDPKALLFDAMRHYINKDHIRRLIGSQSLMKCQPERFYNQVLQRVCHSQCSDQE